MKNLKGDEDDHETRSELDRRMFGKVVVAGVTGLTLGVATDAEAKDCSLVKRPDACPAERPGDHCAGGIEQENSNCVHILDVNKPPDVIVVGAGLSGLIAARQLVRAGKKVLVLEGNCRIGGRMFGRKTVSGGYVDYGGQWVGPTQYEMMALVTELGITPFDSFERGKSVNKFGDKKTDFNGDVSGLLEGDCQTLDFTGLTGCNLPIMDKCVPEPAEKKVWKERLLKLSSTIPADRPWDTPEAVKWDGMTFKDWLEKPASEGGGGAPDPLSYPHWLPTFQANVGGAGGFEPSQASALHMAWTQCVSPQSETPEKWLLCGGAGQIPEILADQIKKESMGESCIHTNAGVTIIAQLKEGGVRITAKLKDGNDRTVNASAVIVAIPPSLRKCIRFETPIGEPGMPTEYREFSEGSPMGSMGKVHAVYETAFWRERCLSGSALGNLETCEFVVDSSPPGGIPGILTAFIAANCNTNIAGDAARNGKSEEEYVKQIALNDFVAYFGSSNDPDWNNQLRAPVDFVYYNWNTKPWTGGAYTCYLGTNVWTRSAKVGWRTPFHDIFWAGTETADRWPGFFDGAISAGKAAASRVLSKVYWTEALKTGNDEHKGCDRRPVLQAGTTYTGWTEWSSSDGQVRNLFSVDCSIVQPRPDVSEGFFSIGDRTKLWTMIDKPFFVQQPYSLTVKVLGDKDDPTRPMLKEPKGWRCEWKDRYGLRFLYSAIAPEGYVALGWVGLNGTGPVQRPRFRCVRSDLVEKGEIGEKIWTSSGGSPCDCCQNYMALWTVKDMPGVFVAELREDSNPPPPWEAKYTGPAVYKLKHLG